MARDLAYKSTESVAADGHEDPYLRPSFSLANRLTRLVWNITWLLLYRPSPRPLHAWRSMLLRLFGAKVGANCHFYPGSKVWAPWNFICGEQCTLGDGAEVYNPSPIIFAEHVIVSQQGYICGATHDYDDRRFPLMSYRMTFGSYAWICARANVSPGVNVGEGAVLGLASTATRDLEPWGVYAGSPAVKVKERRNFLHEIQ